MLSCTTKIADRWRRTYSFVRYQEIDVSAVEHQSFQIVHAALIKLQGPKAFPGFANDGAYAPTTVSAQLDFVVLVRHHSAKVSRSPALSPLVPVPVTASDVARSTSVISSTRAALANNGHGTNSTCSTQAALPKEPEEGLLISTP